MNNKNQFAVQQLRTKNLNKGVETISIFVAAVVANMLVPQLLIRYVYDPTLLTEAPPIFEYLPLVTYSIALAFFLYAMIGNLLREMKAKKMEIELSLYAGDCTCGDCTDGKCSKDDEISDDELKELEKIVDQALKPSKKSSTKKVTKKTTSRKSTKKTK
ncbi:MAG: hypothetical protein H6772_00300 [Pseudomonadales bacterium]|nr:hypothetical protein [Pseudomonadales bacterium]